MNEPKTYKIKTVQDFLQVPEDRLDDCLSEFKDYLQVARDISELVKVMAECCGAEKPDQTNEFIWIDDGLRKKGVTIITKFEIAQTNSSV